MKWPGSARHLIAVCLLLLVGAWQPLEYATRKAQPLYDSAQYVTMAYNMAKYGVSSVSLDDSPLVKPDLLREPVPAFVLSLPMRVMNLDQIPLSCLLAEGSPCDDIMKVERSVNVAVTLLLIPGVYLLTYWLTTSFGWAVAAAATVGTNSIIPSYVWVYSSEIFAALFLLWHSVLLYGAVSGRARVLCALGSGVFLAALVLSKAVFFYWLACLAAVAIVALLLPRRFKSRAVALTLILVFLPAGSGVGSWMARNHALSGQFVVSERADSVLAVRAGYTTISWRQYFAGYVYFTPYVGPSVAHHLFGDVAEKAYDDNIPGGVERHVMAGVPTTIGLGADAQRREMFGLMLKNWDKQLALIPLMGFRGMFIGGCCTTLGNTVPWYGYSASAVGGLVWSVQVLLTILLGPAMLWLTCLLVRRRMWAYFGFIGIVLFSFLIHATATQFYSRFSLPSYPNLVVMLFILLRLLMTDRLSGSRGSHSTTREPQGKPTGRSTE